MLTSHTAALLVERAREARVKLREHRKSGRALDPGKAFGGCLKHLVILERQRAGCVVIFGSGDEMHGDVRCRKRFEQVVDA